MSDRASHPERPLGLTLVVPSFRGGGAERVLVALANAFAARGHDVELIACDAVGPYGAEVTAAVRVVDLGRPRVSRCVPGLARRLRARRPDAALSTMSHVNLSVSLARRLAGVGAGTRLILREAMPVEQGLVAIGSFPERALARAAYRGCDDVVFVSEAQRLRFEAALSLGPGVRRHVIVNPAPVPPPCGDASSHPPWPPGPEPVVLGVGRLADQKDFGTLIRAVAEVRRRRPSRPCRLVILGEGERRGELERLVAELGLCDAVALPGFVPDPFPAMHAAAVFALSSRFEGMPNALVQAVSLGTPAVSTDCPCGPSEVLRGGSIGPLVPVGDVGAMAAAISAQLDRDGRAEPPAEWVRAFAFDTAVERYLAVCRGEAEGVGPGASGPMRGGA